jgi:hypothetical protein
MRVISPEGIRPAVRCMKWYWAAWQPSGASVRRFDLDKETPHVCREYGADE